MAAEHEDSRTRELKDELRGMPVVELVQMKQATQDFLEILHAIIGEKAN